MAYFDGDIFVILDHREHPIYHYPTNKHCKIYYTFSDNISATVDIGTNYLLLSVVGSFLIRLINYTRAWPVGTFSHD